jgi:A/G-specific adenine glycosylase
VSNSPSFSGRIIAWQRIHGRHDLPWQRTRDPYRIWLSEIMLQQTQVTTVLPYFARFLAAFPDVGALARAEEDAVLALWSGLGYYARARNLHRAARAMTERGSFPETAAEWAEFPGVGRSTAAAIVVFSFGRREAILDGNVKRVLARHFLVDGFPGDKKVETGLWTLAESLLPRADVEAYTQGLMDLGATVCTRSRPPCEACPLSDSCGALREQRIGSLPAPRPARARPSRSVTMLVVLRGRQVLLEKRPSQGIWGGLWSLPEVATPKLAASACRARTGVDAVPAGTLDRVEHGFTHYSLTITPRVYRVPMQALGAREAGVDWVDIDSLQDVALPAPVRRILATAAQLSAGD